MIGLRVQEASLGAELVYVAAPQILRRQSKGSRVRMGSKAPWAAIELVTLHGLEFSVPLSPKVSGWGFYNWVSG